MERAHARQATGEELQELADALDRDPDGSVTASMEEWLEQRRQGIALPGEARANAMMAEILEAGRVIDQPQSGAAEAVDLRQHGAAGAPANIHQPADEAPAKILPLSPRKRYGRIAAAAAILLLAGAAYFLLRQPSPAPPAIVSTTPDKPATEALPGGKKALLTLANGATVALDEQHPDTITRQGNTNIIKTSEGRLVYQPGNVTATGLALRNKVSTPRGGQYQVDLADGTRVWLNAASSLQFPVDFNGSERVVELEGEAYFEVAQNSRQPFIVKTTQTTIQVLGTRFNISAYSDETWQKTTLLQGKVQVLAGDARYRLQPGQQVIFDKKAAAAKLVRNANTEEAVAWKNGYFQFSGADATTLLREISRWYNIEVVFNGVPTGYELSGKIDRNIRLSSVVTALREGGVHCTLEGNKLIVTQ
ncbi:FecR family protein [Chitinophaga cymbidii]|nr:FecR family protein [Chitinophaga cymbidii]